MKHDENHMQTSNLIIVKFEGFEYLADLATNKVYYNDTLDEMLAVGPTTHLVKMRVLRLANEKRGLQ